MLNLTEFLTKYGYKTPELMVKMALSSPPSPELIKEVEEMMAELSATLEQEMKSRR